VASCAASSTEIFQVHIETARPVSEMGDWSGLLQQPEPPVAPIRDGRAIPQPLSRKG
jgi:hypothetical protein